MGKNTKKAETLGMPHGTASGRLRKSIMFKYVILAGDNFCFKCGAEIESVDELSIEHKEPWEGISADLFFDLDNIAFSHLRCNIPHNRYKPERKKPNDLGEFLCSMCKVYKPKEDFHRNARNKFKLSNSCKKCFSENYSKKRNRSTQK